MNFMNYSIGLTGTMGSGKSTVLSFFADLGIEIISADEIAKNLTNSQEPAFKKITSYFGPTVINAAGELDRRTIRRRIFNNPVERLWLEEWLHPLIREAIEQQIHQIKSPYCLIEIPLLTEKSHYPYLNRVLLIQSDFEKQIERCMIRDKHSREEILAILATQADKETLNALADDVLINDGTIEELELKVKKLHTNYLALSRH